MKAVPVGKSICSEECQQKYNNIMKRRRFTLIFLWIMIFAFIAVVLYFQYQGA
jgi:predicted nucleic acid-binding Zn ribbon protein